MRPELAPWIEHLWTVDWDLANGPPHESTVISFPALHLTVEWGRPGEVRHGVPLPATLLHGTVSRVFRVALCAAGGVIGARFSPGGFQAWTGVDASTLTDQTVPAAEVLGQRMGSLAAELCDLAPAMRARALDARLAEWTPPRPADAEVTELVRRVAAEGALVRVEQLVELSGLSLRTLQRRFRSNLGVSPKWVLARFRLQEAALALERNPDADLADLAVGLGFYDQAHLTNAFGRLIGETPAQYAARARLPS